jgi:hypothetical protein
MMGVSPPLLSSADDIDQQPLLNALTHSLLLRDQQASEIASLKSNSVALSNVPTSNQIQNRPNSHTPKNDQDQEVDHRAIERERRKKERDREREEEIQEREAEVGRRERWVIEEMRKLTDKVQ